MFIFQELNLRKLPRVNHEKLVKFVEKIYLGYRRDVEYHNDIHAADVALFVHHVFTKGGLLKLTQATKLDQLSTLVAAVCHDFAHDGFTNAFHVNSLSERALMFNDQSV